ncbi:MAG: hypothetical protein QXQ46_09385 [Thermoplasmatales archaeon]
MRPYPFIWKKLAVSGLFLLNAFVCDVKYTDVVVAMVFEIIIFVVVILLIKHSIKNAGQQEKDVFAIIGYNVMKEHTGTDEVRGIRPGKVIDFLRKINEYTRGFRGKRAAI